MNVNLGSPMTAPPTPPPPSSSSTATTTTTTASPHLNHHHHHHHHHHDNGSNSNNDHRGSNVTHHQHQLQHQHQHERQHLHLHPHPHPHELLLNDESTGNHDNSSLWDQLNDEQSREVQQHQSRFHAIPLHSRAHPQNVLLSMVSSSVDGVADTLSSAFHSIKSQVSQLQNQHNQHHHHLRLLNNHNHNNNQNYAYRRVSNDFSAYRPPTIHEHPNSQSQTADDEHHFGLQELQPTLSSDSDSQGTNHTNHTNHNRSVHQSFPNNDNNNNNSPPFVLLNSSLRFTPPARDQWGAVGNLDVFLKHLYQFYYHRGVVPIICQSIVDWLTLLVTIILSIILFKYVDWKLLFTCHDETTCHEHFSNYIKQSNNSSFLVNLWINIYILLLSGYTIFQLWTIWQTYHHAKVSEFVIHEKLGISKRQLQAGTVQWDAIVQQLCHVQSSGQYRMVITQLPLDALVIAQRILRKENFLIALHNQGLLNTQVRGVHYWGQSLEWTIYVCVLNFMFSTKYHLRPAFYLDPMSLKRRFILCGILHAIGLPFLVVFLTLHFILKHVYDFKQTQRYMGDGREWSSYALWHIREFNELPHALEQRLEPSYAAADEYLQLFGHSEYLAAIGRLLVFCGGAVGGILLIVAAVVGDAVLLHVQLGGRNLLWYAGIAGIIYSIGKALLPNKANRPHVTRNLFQDMDAALDNITKHTHNTNFNGRKGHDQKVYSQISSSIQYKVKLFLFQELASVIFAPYILCVQLPKCAEAICEFCLLCKSRIPGAGDVCGFATFDFETFQDEAWEGRTMGGTNNNNSTRRQSSSLRESLAESILRTGSVEDATRIHPKPKALYGKMEKSFFSFQAVHPNWKCTTPKQQAMVDRVQEYRQIALQQERQLHMEAAARQLETLARLESRQQTSAAAATTPAAAPATTLPKSIQDFHGKTVAQDINTKQTCVQEEEGQRIPSADMGAGSTTSPTALSLGRFDLQQQQQQQNSLSGSESVSNHSIHHAQNKITSSSQQPTQDHQSHQQMMVSSQQNQEMDKQYTQPLLPQHPPQTELYHNLGHENQHQTASTPQSNHRPEQKQHRNQQERLTQLPSLSPLPQQPLAIPHSHQQHHTQQAPPHIQRADQSITLPLQEHQQQEEQPVQLSTELRRLLHVSATLEATGSNINQAEPNNITSTLSIQQPGMDRSTERQYLWLERYHAHLENQRREEQAMLARRDISQSDPLPVAHLSGSGNNDSNDNDNDPSNINTKAWEGGHASSMV